MDYRSLNQVMIKDRHMLLLIIEIQDKLKGVKIFIKLNIIDAYN